MGINGVEVLCNVFVRRNIESRFSCESLTTKPRFYVSSKKHV